MTERFFCPTPPRHGLIRLEGDESRHLSRVRRLGPGAMVEVFDGGGFATRAVVIAQGKDWVDLEVVGDPLPDRVTPCRLTLATAVPKGERLDWLVAGPDHGDRAVSHPDRRGGHEAASSEPEARS